MEKLHITMLGARGVGKTSLLSGMYDQFDSALLQGTNLCLTPDSESQIRLGRKLAELKRQGDDFDASPTVTGTADSQQFSFGLGRIAEPPRFQLVFRDYPGGWLHDAKRHPDIHKFIRESQVILLAVDAPSLMELNGKWNEEINAVSQIRDCLKEALQEVPSDLQQKLVMVCPIKCERYVQNLSTRDDLLKKIDKNYEGIFDLLRNEPLEGKTAVAVVPVQTLGNVWFSRFSEHGEGLPNYHFRRIKSDEPGYAPRHVEQPLCYTVSFALKQYLERRSLVKMVGDWFSNRNVAFDHALKELANKRKSKSEEGFIIKQGGHLLSN